MLSSLAMFILLSQLLSLKASPLPLAVSSGLSMCFWYIVMYLVQGTAHLIVYNLESKGLVQGRFQFARLTFSGITFVFVD